MHNVPGYLYYKGIISVVEASIMLSKPWHSRTDILQMIQHFWTDPFLADFDVFQKKHVKQKIDFYILK